MGKVFGLGCFCLFVVGVWCFFLGGFVCLFFRGKDLWVGVSMCGRFVWLVCLGFGFVVLGFLEGLGVCCFFF